MATPIFLFNCSFVSESDKVSRCLDSPWGTWLLTHASGRAEKHGVNATVTFSGDVFLLQLFLLNVADSRTQSHREELYNSVKLLRSCVK